MHMMHARITHLQHVDRNRGGVDPHAAAGFSIIANLHTGRGLDYSTCPEFST